MMNGTNEGGQIKHAKEMRVLGIILILLCTCEFGIGGAVYNWLTNVKLGAWWASICPFIAGIFAVWNSSRFTVTAGCVFAILGVIIGIIGSAVDSISAEVFASESGCVNNETGEVYGTSDGQTLALDCSYAYSSSAYYYYQYQCICAGVDSSCYYYDLTQGGNCGAVLTTYTRLISASAVFTVLVTLTCFVYSIFTCVVVCGSSSYIPPPSVQLADDPHMYSQVEMMSTHGGGAVAAATELSLSVQHTLPPVGVQFAHAAPPQQLVYNPIGGGQPVIYVLSTAQTSDDASPNP